MKKPITVRFIKYYNYNIYAENGEEAIKIAEEYFECDRRYDRTIDFTYDEVETREEKDVEPEECYNYEGQE